MYENLKQESKKHKNRAKIAKLYKDDSITTESCKICAKTAKLLLKISNKLKGYCK